LLKELAQNEASREPTLFMKWWPLYARFVCPTIIALILLRSL